MGGQVEVGVEERETRVERESRWEAGRSLLEHFEPNVSVRMFFPLGGLSECENVKMAIRTIIVEVLLDATLVRFGTPQILRT